MAGTPQTVTGEADQSSSSLELDELFELEFELELLLEFDELLEFEFELELLFEFDELFELEFELLLLFELLFEFFFFFLRSPSRRSSSSPRWLRLTKRTSSGLSARKRSPEPAFQGRLARNWPRAVRNGSPPRDPSSALAVPASAVVATSAMARTDLTVFILRFLSG